MLHVQAPEVDPFDALASILPSADPVAPQQPVYTGPEVKEVQHSHTCVFIQKLSGYLIALSCSMDLLWVIVCVACITAWHHFWEGSEVWRKRRHAASRLQIWRYGQFFQVSSSSSLTCSDSRISFATLCVFIVQVLRDHFLSRKFLWKLFTVRSASSVMPFFNAKQNLIALRWRCQVQCTQSWPQKPCQIHNLVNLFCSECWKSCYIGTNIKTWKIKLSPRDGYLQTWTRTTKTTCMARYHVCRRTGPLRQYLRPLRPWVISAFITYFPFLLCFFLGSSSCRC